MDLKLKKLKRFNLIMGTFHLVQAVLMLIFATTVIQKIAEFQPKIIQLYLAFNPETRSLETSSKELFQLPFGILVACFLFISAFAHYLIVLNSKRYFEDLQKGINQFRWFVWAIVGTYFIAFNTFPINMILQYKRIGKWKDYLYGERVYIILSLLAKSFLAWLVLFGAMQP